MDGSDVHVCCLCCKTFLSLDGYVTHRKQGCSQRKTLPTVTTRSVDNFSSVIPTLDTNSTLEHISSNADNNTAPSIGSSQPMHSFLLDHLYVQNFAKAQDQIDDSSKIGTDSSEVMMTINLDNTRTGKLSDATPCYESCNKRIDRSYIESSDSRHQNDTPICTVTSSAPTNVTPVSSTAAPANINADLNEYVASFDEFFTSLQLKHCIPDKSSKSKAGHVDNGISSVADSQDKDSLSMNTVVDESNVTADTTPKAASTLEERLKGIKIANILNDFDFSSDSDLPSDVDELLNFSDDDERAVSGGKWKPTIPTAKGGKGKVSAKLSSHMRIAGKNIANGGKWKPGATPVGSLNSKSGTLNFNLFFRLLHSRKTI